MKLVFELENILTSPTPITTQQHVQG